MGGKYVFLLQKNIKEKRINLNHIWFFSLKKNRVLGEMANHQHMIEKNNT